MSTRSTVLFSAIFAVGITMAIIVNRIQETSADNSSDFLASDLAMEEIHPNATFVVKKVEEIPGQSGLRLVRATDDNALGFSLFATDPAIKIGDAVRVIRVHYPFNVSSVASVCGVAEKK